jgi:hypothetical protein
MTSERLAWIISGLDWDKLDDWEEKFVESIERYFKSHRDLTRAQENRLEEIFRTKSR